MVFGQVEDPHNQLLHENHGKSEGQFAFTTKVAGEYKACFTVRGGFVLHAVVAGGNLVAHHTRQRGPLQPAQACLQHWAVMLDESSMHPSYGSTHACTSADLQTAYNTKLRLDWRTGVAATDWNSIAKKEHLDQVCVLGNGDIQQQQCSTRETQSIRMGCASMRGGASAAGCISTTATVPYQGP
jgi:hypothetical protein